MPEKICILWDLQNVSFRQSTKLQRAFSTISSVAESRGKILAWNVYGNPVRQNHAVRLACLSHRATYKVIESTAKNAADYQLISHCLDLRVQLKPDVIFLVTGDGDYAALVQTLSDLGVEVFIFGRKNLISKRLARFASQVVPITDLMDSQAAA